MGGARDREWRAGGEWRVQGGGGACIFRMVRCRGHNISFFSGGVQKVLLLFIINIASSHSFPKQ